MSQNPQHHGHDGRSAEDAARSRMAAKAGAAAPQAVDPRIAAFMRHGWIRVWRLFFEGELWCEHRRFSKAECLLDILVQARHSSEPETILIKNLVLKCSQGEVLFSINTWAQRWHTTRSGAHRTLKLLERLGYVTVTSEHVTVRVAVRNYLALYAAGGAGAQALPPLAPPQDDATVPATAVKSGVSGDACVTPIPAELDVPGFRSLWQDFCEYCRGAGRPMVSKRAELTLQELVRLSHGDAAEACKLVAHAIQMGWVAICAPRPEPRRDSRPQRAPATGTDSELEDIGDDV